VCSILAYPFSYVTPCLNSSSLVTYYCPVFHQFAVEFSSMLVCIQKSTYNKYIKAHECLLIIGKYPRGSQRTLQAPSQATCRGVETPDCVTSHGRFLFLSESIYTPCQGSERGSFPSISSEGPPSLTSIVNPPVAIPHSPLRAGAWV